MSQSVKLTEVMRMRHGWREGGRKLYSAKLCKYTHFTLRSVSKSNILKLICLLLYCTGLSPKCIMIIIMMII